MPPVVNASRIAAVLLLAFSPGLPELPATSRSHFGMRARASQRDTVKAARKRSSASVGVAGRPGLQADDAVVAQPVSAAATAG